MGRKRNSDGEEEESSQGSGKSETISISSDMDSPPSEKLKKYKRSHKYKLSESEFSDDENEASEYIEKRRHKHKHKKHKRDHKHKSEHNEEVHKHRSEHYEDVPKQRSHYEDVHKHKSENYEEVYRHHKRKHSHHRSTKEESRSKHRRHNTDSDSRSKHSSQRKRERHRNTEDNMSQSIDTVLETEQQSSRWDEESDSNLLRPIKTEPLSDSNEEQPRNNRNQNERNSRNHNEGGRPDAVVKKEDSAEPESKETVNLGLSGKLTEDANTYNGIVIKYSQPPEARKPKRRWRWYIFKGEDELPFLPLHRQSAYLIGRERKVADIPTDHPSCSKQHAVFQYRLVSYDRDDGSTGRTVKPYILDLESANGTYVNNRRIDPRRYVELLEKDVVKFGYSSREYVLLHEASKGSDDEMLDAGADVSPVSMLRHH